jgi:hypothetical protein
VPKLDWFTIGQGNDQLLAPHLLPNLIGVRASHAASPSARRDPVSCDSNESYGELHGKCGGTYRALPLAHPSQTGVQEQVG